jgi:ubiquinone/menaquinone biosynthesis C-methylase UbiE
VNLDVSETRCDVRHDVREPLPFPDGEFDEIYASGILEQIGPNEEFCDLMNECHRVLGRGGRMTVIVPNAKYPAAFRDPFDCRRFTEETWNYFDVDNRYWKNYGDLYGFLPWKVLQVVSANENGIMTAVLEKR